MVNESKCFPLSMVLDDKVISSFHLLKGQELICLPSPGINAYDDDLSFFCPGASCLIHTLKVLHLVVARLVF